MLRIISIVRAVIVVIAVCLASVLPFQKPYASDGVSCDKDNGGHKRISVLIQGYDFPDKKTGHHNTSIFQHQMNMWGQVLEQSLSFPGDDILWLPEDNAQRGSPYRDSSGREMLDKALRFLTDRKPGKCDLFVLIFAGHGNKSGWAWRYNKSPEESDWIVWNPLRARRGRSLQYGNILKFIRDVQATGVGHIIVAADACHSGSFINYVGKAWNKATSLSIFTATDANHSCPHMGSYMVQRNMAQRCRIYFFGGIYFSELRKELIKISESGKAARTDNMLVGASEMEAAFESAHDTASECIGDITDTKIQLLEEDSISQTGKGFTEAQSSQLWIRHYVNPKKKLFR